MKKRSAAIVIIFLSLVIGSLTVEAGIVEGFSYGESTGVAILNCNSNGCAAATSCNNYDVKADLKGYFFDEAGMLRYSYTESTDYEIVTIVFYSNSSHDYFYAISHHFVNEEEVLEDPLYMSRTD